MAERIYLVGFMGAGKTTAGRLAAERLGWTFLDLDEEIEREERATVAEIFESHGEPRFRELEAHYLRRTAGACKCVVALGGGAYVDRANREFIEEHGVSVYLHASLESVLERLSPDGRRPLFTDMERAAALYAGRLASYMMARVRIDTDRSVPEEVADRIAEAAGLL